MIEVPHISIERTLAQLRWRPSEFEEETLLRRIAEHDAYWVFTRDGELLHAPDSRERRLPAVFTSIAACDSYLAQCGLSRDVVRCQQLDGRALHKTLSAAPGDGIVFNCTGPEPAVAFVPELLVRLRPFVAAPHDRAPRTAAEFIDFDAMAADAFPDQQPGDHAAIDLLCHATFALAEWFMIASPTSPGEPLTRRDNRGVRRAAYFFTDARRAQRFIDVNQLRTAQGVPAVATPIAPATVMQWSRQHAFPGAVERVHFNFGGPGWFAPPGNLARLNDQLNILPQ